jgi:CrcB protein
VRILLIGLGGFVGSILRYWLSGLAHAVVPKSSFPVGTLTVNVVGCLGIGVVMYFAEARQVLDPQTRAFVVVGLLGGFTTFSAFANETVSALRADSIHIAIANVLVSVTACLLAVVAGRSIAPLIWR